MSDWKDKVAAQKLAKQSTKIQARASSSSNTGVKINTQGWRSSGNAYLFQLEINETIVAYCLNKGSFAIKNTQNCFSYDFEFHPMHTTGNPVYIRMVGNDDTSLITKFDTKNKTTAPIFSGRGTGSKKSYDFHNLDKLTLSSTELQEMEILIKDNFEFLKYMAKCIYEDDGII